MDNKTKVKVAVVIGIIILAVIFILMVIFVKGNRTKVNKNIPTKTSNTYEAPDEDKSNNKSNEKEEISDNKNKEKITLDETVSIGIKNEEIVIINSELKSKSIKKVKNGYSDFCYGDNKIYELINDKDGIKIIEINLEDEDYPEKVILSTNDYGLVDGINYYSGKLYFVSGNGRLVEYSISEEHFEFLTNENEVSSFAIDKDNNCIYVGYKPEGENAGVYRFDFTENNFIELISLNELPGEMMIKGKALVIDVKELGAIYAYDIEKQTVLEIGSNNYLQKASYHIAFYDNYILYTDGSKIDLKDNSGNSFQDGWYNLNDNSISRISMISKTKLQIARKDEDGEVTKSIIIDLTNGNAVEEPETVYFDLILIK